MMKNIPLSIKEGLWSLIGRDESNGNIIVVPDDDDNEDNSDEKIFGAMRTPKTTIMTLPIQTLPLSMKRKKKMMAVLKVKEWEMIMQDYIER
jgi:hypothetical protein